MAAAQSRGERSRGLFVLLVRCHGCPLSVVRGGESAGALGSFVAFCGGGPGESPGALGSFVAFSIGDGTGAAAPRRAARLSSPLAPDPSPLSARRFRNCSRIRIKVRWHASWYRRSRSPSAVSSNPSRASAAADSDSRRRASNSSSRSSSSDDQRQQRLTARLRVRRRLPLHVSVRLAAGCTAPARRGAARWPRREAVDFPSGSIAPHAR